MIGNKEVNIIVATSMAKNKPHPIDSLIGNNNELPWKEDKDKDFIKTDMRMFRNFTKGGMCVMGRKTRESIGKSLDKRFSCILTSNINEFYDRSDVEKYFDNVEGVINYIKEDTTDRSVWIIGGENIYNLFLDLKLVDTIYRSIILEEYKGNKFFPMNKVYNPYDDAKTRLSKFKYIRIFPVIDKLSLTVYSKKDINVNAFEERVNEIIKISK